MPIMQPGSAAANHTQPCSEPDATPPTNAPILQPKPMRAPHPINSPPMAAAASDFNGGHGLRANGALAAAAAMAPRIMPNGNRADDDPARRRERGAAPTRNRNRAERGNGQARPGRRETAPGAEIIRGKNRIDAAKPEECRQVEAAEDAAGDEQRQRDQHAAGAAADGVECARAATVGELHADAEYKRSDDQRRPDRRNGATEAGHQRRDRNDDGRGNTDQQQPAEKAIGLPAHDQPPP